MSAKPFSKIFLPIFLLLSLFSFSQGDSIAGKPAPQKKKSPFADTQELTKSDYLAAIERANELMNTVSNEGVFRRKTLYTFQEISATNASINLITSNIKGVSNTNIRNQRMYEKVLFELQGELFKFQEILNDDTEKIIGLKKHLRTIMKDTVFSKLVRDSVARAQFKRQLMPLRMKFFATDSVLKSNLLILDAHKAENTNKKMVIGEALAVVNERLDKSGISIFRHECANLWDTDIKIRNQSISSFIAEKFFVELKAFIYYFKYSYPSTLLLLLFMGILYWWVRYNLKGLKAADKMETLTDFNFRALNRGVLLPVVVVGLNIAIAFNLYAPALYIEFLHFLLMVTLSVIFFERWPGAAYRRWLLLLLIFAGFSFMDLFLKITLLQRCLFIIANILAIRYGLAHLKFIREQLYIKILFTWANYLFIAFNVLAIIFNLFGRVSLAYTLSLTAIIAMTQMIALSVLLKIILEMIILQVYTIRIRRGISKIFDYVSLEKNAQKPFMLIILYMWIVVTASNLNLSDTLYNLFDRVFTRQNEIGSFKFTIGGVVLFLGIIWIAHLLQKFVAFFFGEIDYENEETVNKRQHSKLLITRLMLLVVGYLLAISASGMPIDKITIILGALGVGVGLGLQSIVSNFVSGVILIFERPIQIGDVIESGNQSGRVKEIGLRTTKIDTANGAEVIIPNGNILSQNITNWTYSNNFKLIEITFTITGEISHEETSKLIDSALKTTDEAVPDMESQIFYDSVSANKARVKVKFWCNIYRTDQAVSEARLALYDAFTSHNIVIEE